MKKLLLVPALLIFLIFVSSCGITIVPQPLSSSDQVNPSDRSITIERASMRLSARVQDTAVGGFSTETPITSFYVEAANKSTKKLKLPLASFSLIDDTGTIYNAVDPAAVSALFLPEHDYLVPFPFVSFLDVTAQESQRASSAMQSEQPYVGRGFAYDPTGTPFPDIVINSGARVAGAVFFEVDLYMLNAVRLQVDDPAGKTPYVFPFSIEK